MKNGYAPVAHHVLKLTVLLGFSVYLSKLALTGEILLFIVPQLVIYVELAVIGLIVFAGFQLYFLIRSFKRPVVLCDCGHHDHHSHGGEAAHSHEQVHGHSHEPPRSIWKNAVVYGLFILPLLFGLGMPSQALAGSLANSKGINLGWTANADRSIPEDLAQADGADDQAIRQLFNSDKYNQDYAKLGMRLYKLDLIEMKDEWFIEKLQALNAFAANFEGKQLKIKGFVYRENGLPGNQFIIGRMAMTHCIADISPYGMIAETPDASHYADDAWVTLTGTIGKTTYRGQTVIKLVIQSAEPAAAPGIPYVYPDWKFASKL